MHFGVVLGVDVRQWGRLGVGCCGGGGKRALGWDARVEIQREFTEYADAFGLSAFSGMIVTCFRPSHFRSA